MFGLESPFCNEFDELVNGYSEEVVEQLKAAHGHFNTTIEVEQRLGVSAPPVIESTLVYESPTKAAIDENEGWSACPPMRTFRKNRRIWQLVDMLLGWWRRILVASARLTSWRGITWTEVCSGLWGFKIMKL